MSMMVQASTDQLAGLEELIEHRRANGLDTFDEWWEGVYRVVPGPSFEHGQLVVRLAVLLGPRASARSLRCGAPANLGVDRLDAKVPDLAIARPDTPRTSPAFLATAELVVEIMSPREVRGEKLPFYASKGVKEYLEVDPPNGTVRLLANRDGTWEPIESSAVIDLAVAEVAGLLT